MFAVQNQFCTFILLCTFPSLFMRHVGSHRCASFTLLFSDHVFLLLQKLMSTVLKLFRIIFIKVFNVVRPLK